MSSIKNVEDFSSIMDKYDPSQNISSRFMSKYEKTKVIGLRLEQLARGATSTVDTSDLFNIRDICLRELDERKIPFIVMRTMPNGNKEFWRLQDLIIS